MAAGRQNFSRKRLETDSRYYQRNYASDLDRSCNEVTKITGDSRRNCFIDHVPEDRKRGVDVSKDGAVSGCNKKRKFSPIVWDRVEKQVKISEKDIRRSSPRAPADFERCLVSAESERRSSSVDSFVSTVSDDVEIPSLLVTRTPEEHVQEIECGVRNLSKSKWAYKDSPRNESNVDNSSPESGELKEEVFEKNNEGSSLSTEDGCFLESDDDNEAVPLCSGLGIWPSCRNVFEFERLGKISEGTYGVVHKARDKKTGDIVALKKVKVGKDREGFPVTALREINILGSLQHPSLVEMKEVVTDDFDGVYMVMEYVDHELKGHMERMRQPFSQSEVKRLMIQLLEGVSYLHDNYVVHRDLKTSNLLLNKKGELKICDFGMSRQYASPLKPYTPLVVTLWYRAPELLLGMKNYSTAIDMWSVGCIMAELLSKKPLFDGSKELEQIDKIFRTLGTPNEFIWPGYSKLPGVKPNFVKQPCSTLRKKFPVAVFTGSPTLTELGFDLLNKFLTYDPEKRITAKEALDHAWFREAPLPAEYVRCTSC